MWHQGISSKAEETHKLSQITTIGTITVVELFKVRVTVRVRVRVRGMFIGWQIGNCAQIALRARHAGTM